jgi:hypothetical protein
MTREQQREKRIREGLAKLAAAHAARQAAKKNEKNG